MGMSAIRHLHISHDRPYLTPKILDNLCFSFLLGITAVPRQTENNIYAKLWGANNMLYGCGSGELTQISPKKLSRATGDEAAFCNSLSC